MLNTHLGDGSHAYGPRHTVEELAGVDEHGGGLGGWGVGASHNLIFLIQNRPRQQYSP